MAVSKLFGQDARGQLEAIVEEDDFARCARAHDRLLGDAIKAWEKLSKATDPHDKEVLTEKALFAHRMADAVKTILRMKWPEVAEEWFGKEEPRGY